MAAIQNEPTSNTSGEYYNPELLAPHRGAIDQTTITTQPPAIVMKKVLGLLKEMGIEVEENGPFRYQCTRAGREVDGVPTPQTDTPPLKPNSQTLYGTFPSEDPGSEVRFTIELTKLTGLSDTYSLAIRRLMGNLRSYKFLYDTIRERAELNT